MTSRKTSYLPGAMTALGLILVLSASPAAAAVFTWDNGSNGLNDSSGTWDTVSSYWYNGSGDTTWTTGGMAQFGIRNGPTNPYTVTLNGAITAGAVNFTNQFYTLAGGTLTLNSATY